MEISNEVWVAIVTVVGVVVGAFFKNWDKIFPNKNKITAKVSGYSPTEVYETELRTFINVSGQRASVETTASQILQHLMIKEIKRNPRDAEKIQIAFHIISKEMITVDDVIRKLLPVYQKYYSIEQLQELNRFYSTKTMQQMVSKNQALAIEAAPIQVELMNDNQEKIRILMKEKLSDINNLLPPSEAHA